MSNTEWTWTDEEQAAVDSMSPTDIAERVRNLSRYDRYDTLVTVYDNDMAMTPAQMTAFAAFAKTLGTDVVITDNSIKREKSGPDLLRAAVRNRVYEIRREARAAEEAAKAAEQDTA